MLFRTGIISLLAALAVVFGAIVAVSLSETPKTTSAQEVVRSEPPTEDEANGSGWSEEAEDPSSSRAKVAAVGEPSGGAPEPSAVGEPSGGAPEPSAVGEPSGASREAPEAPEAFREASLESLGKPSKRTDNGPEPAPKELATAGSPRYYEPRANAALSLSVEKMGIYDIPVADSRGPRALDNGPIHVPETPMPWSEKEEKNVYIAAHRLGVPGTNSRLAFYHLDKMQGGDEVVLKDREGNEYRYRVTEVFEVNPEDVWVVDTLIGRDIVTLQTCTPIPTFEKRLIVRADRI